MARVSKKKQLRPSILDRLIDDDPDLRVEPEKSKNQHIAELRNSVRRDVENLLNTRYRMIGPPPQYKEIGSSIINYGLPDLATINVADTNKRKRFIKEMESVLKKYEPRFKSIKVSYQENKDNSDRTLRFRIDATLYADPAPEVIIFDSILEPVSRTVNVEESQHG